MVGTDVETGRGEGKSLWLYRDVTLRECFLWGFPTRVHPHLTPQLLALMTGLGCTAGQGVTTLSLAHSIPLLCGHRYVEQRHQERHAQRGVS